jgi:hypothetical protein
MDHEKSLLASGCKASFRARLLMFEREDKRGWRRLAGDRARKAKSIKFLILFKGNKIFSYSLLNIHFQTLPVLNSLLATYRMTIFINKPRAAQKGIKIKLFKIIAKKNSLLLLLPLNPPK